MQESNRWAAAGECEVARRNGRIVITAPLYRPRRPQGELELGDCSNYGLFGADCLIPGENWEGYNRISFTLRVEAQGVRKVCARLCLRNEGRIRLPDPYNRDGFHAVNLQPGRTERICVEMPTLPRDRMTGVGVQFYCGGCETDAGLGNRLTAEVWDMALERIETPEIAVGWQPAPGEIVHCFSGYRPLSRKIALMLSHAGEPFAVEDLQGVARFTGRLAPSGFHDLCVLDFTALEAAGRYRLRVGETVTSPFSVSETIWLPSAWKTVNFLFCERCGYPVPGIHQTCHRDVIARHGGRRFVFNGGWHDAGDLSQQLIQSAEVTWALFELAQALPEDQLDLRLRLQEEGLWGLDYVLRSRFGDGYRATSVGTAMWSQGFTGDADDITARLHNNAYENFLCAAVECYCAMRLTREDPGLSATALRCAVADFGFARERFSQTGFNERPPIYWEHSWMTSESAFQATVALAASLLLEATGDAQYAAHAAQALDYVLACQHTAPAGPRFERGGFFYRNTQRVSIMHFSHQARDQIFAQALTEALRAMPEHPKAGAWLEALSRHADYLRGLMRLASPYGMAPAGLYRLEERDDRDSFARQHLETGDEAYAHYARQLEAGTDVGDGYTLRHFPVWFSFKGNNAVLLSMGKAMALCAKALGDRSLLLDAERQLGWNIGVNPFRQSLMYGEGDRYAQQYAAMSGEAAGELPVGVQTLDDEDAPYWPQMNNATYKEVWTTPAARWLSILADLAQPC
ncbi:MAG: endoglucanase [Clostridiales bacterium]|nr:endoglucanase [Clostridiales bacterium]